MRYRRGWIVSILSFGLLLSGCGQSEAAKNDFDVNAAEEGDESSEDKFIVIDDIASVTDIPESYSLIDEGKVTDFKYKNQTAMCWLYATAAATESTLITQGYEDLGVDISEGHICYYIYPFAEDRAQSSTEDGIYVLGDKKTNKVIPYHAGGYPELIPRLYATGAGPAYEEVAPIIEGDAALLKCVDDMFKFEEEGKLTKYMGDYLLTEMNEYTEDDDIKKAIISNGAVVTSIVTPSDKKSGGFCKDSEDDGCLFFNDINTSTADTDHPVAIVGWDDNYSKDNFVQSPQSSGAWLIKDTSSNSTVRNNKGYYWMSYEELHDTNFGMLFSEREKYGDILSYDSIGPLDHIKAEGDYTTVANIFSAENDGGVKGVGISTAFPEQKINVSLYINPDKDIPDSGEKVFSADYLISKPGYQVIDIDQEISIAKGSPFSIVVQYENSSEHEGIAPVEGDTSLMNLAPLGELYIISQEGESYAKEGDKWYDLSKEETSLVFNKEGLINNACIKALMSQ